MIRFRIEYKKVGPIRFTSHRDTMSVFRRGFVSAGLPLCYSQGFNPHPRLSFGPSLRTGWEGLGEYMDVLLESPVSDLAEVCNPFLPEGLEITRSARIDDAVPKLSKAIRAARYNVRLSADDLAPGHHPEWDAARDKTGAATVAEALARAIEDRLAGERDGSVPSLLDLNARDTDEGITVDYTTTMDNGKGLSCDDLLGPVLGDLADLDVPVAVVRKALLSQEGDRYVYPIDRKE